MIDPSPLPSLAGASTRRMCLRRLLAPAMVALVAGTGRGSDFQWKVVQANGRDYVPLSDLKKFYQMARMSREGRNVFLQSATLRMKFTGSSDAVYINNVKFCLSFPVLDRGGDLLVSRVDLAKLLDPIIRPTHIRQAEPFHTVVIDPGHGGHDSGAVGAYGAEKHYALDTALRLETELKKKGYRTVLTRRKDVFITLAGRVKIANSTPRSIFVSIHFNSYRSSAIGLETFALAPAGTAATYKSLKETDLMARRGNVRDSENIALATAVHSNALYVLRSVDRGIKRDRFSVISGCEKPGILVEGGFVTNPTEGARIHRPEYRQQLAEAIAGGIDRYRRALQARPAAAASAQR